MSIIIDSIHKELQANKDEKTQATFQRFFKEKAICYGVKTATVRKIAEKFWTEVKKLDKKEIFAICEGLYRTDFTEDAFVVSYWLPNYVDNFESKDIEKFRHWIEKYINNWAKCDGLCNHTIGSFVEKYPESICELKKWAKSENRWLRRAAAVSLIVPAKKGHFLNEAIEISDLLLNDGEDLVQKGYGWLLKEESRKHQEKVFEYLTKNKKEMPRVALRYAIELMPKELKLAAMKKE